MNLLKKLVNKIITYDSFVYLLALLAFLLPLPLKENITSLVMILVVVFTLLVNLKNLFQYSRLKEDRFFILNLIVFLLFIIGTAYADDLSYSVSQLQKMIPFILLPLVLSSYKYTNYDFLLILRMYVLGVVCYTVILWAGVYNLYLTDEILNKKIGLNFTLHSFIRKTEVSVHHAYVGMYITLSIVVSLYLLGKANTQKNKWIYRVLLVYLLMNFPWLSGKTSLLMLAFILVVYGMFNKTNKYNTNIITITVLIFLIVIPLFFLDHEWIMTLFKSSFAERLKIYNAGYNATLDNLPFGIGNSNTKLELEKYFLREGNADLVGMATHNTFLSFSLRFGVLGALFILYYFFYLFKESLKKNRILLLSMCIIVLFSSFTEHIFDTHRGRFFVLFFLSFFYYAYQTREKIEIKG